MKDNITLLIIDDDADDRKLFIEAVNDFDPEIICLTANDGQQGSKPLKILVNNYVLTKI